MTDAEFKARHIRGEFEASGIASLFSSVEEFVDEFYERGDVWLLDDGSSIVNEGGKLVVVN